MNERELAVVVEPDVIIGRDVQGVAIVDRFEFIVRLESVEQFTRRAPANQPRRCREIIPSKDPLIEVGGPEDTGGRGLNRLDAVAERDSADEAAILGIEASVELGLGWMGAFADQQELIVQRLDVVNHEGLAFDRGIGYHYAILEEDRPIRSKRQGILFRGSHAVIGRLGIRRLLREERVDSAIRTDVEGHKVGLPPHGADITQRIELECTHPITDDGCS